MKKTIGLLIAAFGLPAAAHAQSSANVASRGDGNHLLIDQSAANGAQINIDQIGDGNQIHLKQVSTGQAAALRIGGLGNTVQAHQQGPGTNALTLTVDGQDNSSQLEQFAFAGGSNVMTVGQWGSGNSATVAQTAYAGANTLSLQQNGNDNIASLAQNGDGNSLALAQNGNANSAAISQNGNGLGFSLTQSGGATIAITQTAP